MSVKEPDPDEIVMLKTRFAALLGLAHGMDYLIQQAHEQLFEEQLREIEALYDKVCAAADLALVEICKDALSRNWALSKPSLASILTDDYLQKLFPLPDAADEASDTVH